MARCIALVLEGTLTDPDAKVFKVDLKVLANQVARNREIAGLHYPSDSRAGRKLARSVFRTLTGQDGADDAKKGDADQRERLVAVFNDAIEHAKGEWS
jgi:hypothetical protein